MADLAQAALVSLAFVGALLFIGFVTVAVSALVHPAVGLLLGFYLLLTGGMYAISS